LLLLLLLLLSVNEFGFLILGKKALPFLVGGELLVGREYRL